MNLFLHSDVTLCHPPNLTLPNLVHRFVTLNRPPLTTEHYQQALGLANGSNLFFEDLWRSAPFDPATTIPDASTMSAAPLAKSRFPSAAGYSNGYLQPETIELARHYLDSIKNIPLLQRVRDRDRRGGSNEWAI
jgi:hypothetical protein